MFTTQNHNISIVDIKKDKCWQCINRPVQIIIAHIVESDAKQFNPSLIQLFKDSFITCWCPECLLRCDYLSKEENDFIRSKIANCLTSSELKRLTKTENAIKQRNEEESKCGCKRHIRLCTPKIDLKAFHIKLYENATYTQQKNADDEYIYHNAYYSTTRGLLNENDKQTKDIITKYNELSTIKKNDYESLAKWLLYITDYHNRYDRMYAHLYNNVNNDINHKHLITLLSTASVFNVYTNCNGDRHILPRPYSNCTCNFSRPHYLNLLETFEMLKIDISMWKK